MVAPVPQDTPMRRASIGTLPVEEIEKLIEGMRERRMRQHNAYEIAQQAKAKIKLEKDQGRYDKVIAMLEKKMDAAEKALDAASKYLNELKVLELVLGE